MEKSNNKDSPNGPIAVQIDLNHPAKPWRGFGCTMMSFEEPEMTERPGANGGRIHGKIPDREILDELVRLAYEEVRLSRGRVFPFRYEGRYEGSDPRRSAQEWSEKEIRERGIDKVLDHVQAAQKHGRLVLFGSVGRMPAHLVEANQRTLKKEAYGEYVHRVLRVLKHWKARYGIELESWALFNEPHYPVQAPSLLPPEGHVELTRLLGRALRDAGHTTRIVVADDWSPRHRALDIARAVLGDEEARSHVCAVGYHNYDGYDFLENDWRKFEDQRAARREMREICESHGVEAWMTEVSNYRPSASEWQDIQFMANEIIDDLTCAGVTAWDFMLGVWQGHWRQNARGGPQGMAEFYYEPDGSIRRVQLTRVATVVGHWSRVIQPGWRQVPVQLDHPDVRATAFISPDATELACVWVNNGSSPVSLEIQIQGGSSGSRAALGFVSNSIDRWGELPPVLPQEDRWLLDLRASSVATVQFPMEDR